MTQLFETDDGLVLCDVHFMETVQMLTPNYRRQPPDIGGQRMFQLLREHEVVMNAATRELFKPRCGMCGQLPSPGRTCQNCELPLHPLWPACYCTNKCAYEDA